MRHLRVLRLGFWCLEVCVFLFDCLLYALWAQLRRGAQRPHSSSSSAAAASFSTSSSSSFSSWR